MMWTLYSLAGVLKELGELEEAEKTGNLLLGWLPTMQFAQIIWE